MLWAGEWNDMTEGNWEKIWACRRGKVPLLGRVRGGGADHHRKLLHPSMITPMGSQRRGISGAGYRQEEDSCLVYSRLSFSYAGYQWLGKFVWAKASEG